jgi:hypothetical protein
MRDRNFILAALLVALAIECICDPLSDRFGRKMMFMTGAAGAGLHSFVYFAGFAMSHPCRSSHTACNYGAEAALITENFPPSVHYFGPAIGYQLASISGGGPTPIIATMKDGRHFDMAGEQSGRAERVVPSRA